MRKNRVQPTFKEVVAMSDVIRAYCVAIDGFAVWENEWSEDRVTISADGRTTPQHVANLRLELIGPIRKPTNREGHESRVGVPYRTLREASRRHRDVGVTALEGTLETDVMWTPARSARRYRKRR